MKKIGTSSHIQETINKNDFKIKKKFGQNFLNDQNILKKIVSVPTITKETLIIEIGPGLGSLTEHLIPLGKHTLLYEIDTQLIPILKNTFQNEPITIIEGDFLQRNIDEDIESLGMTFDSVVVVSNLPYYITTPIIFKILEESSYINTMTLMMQLEVAKRLTSKPSVKDYNALSVVIQYKTKASIAMKVPRTVFIPEPNVDSAIVLLEVKETKDRVPNNENLFYKLVKASFQQRRKTLKNNLNKAFGISKEDLSVLLEDCDIKDSARAEVLSVDDFIGLADRLELEMK
jgi:16S rRNA (adenine1518-N6/adenine1519-N6)-dimethyltransferase